MTGSHLQVLQPFLVGFEATLPFAFDAMGAENYAHVESITSFKRGKKAGRCDGALFAMLPWKSAMIGWLGDCPINVLEVNPSNDSVIHNP